MMRQVKSLSNIFTCCLQTLLLLFVVLFASEFSPALADDYALYDNTGAAVAYIATNDEYTIYSWGGEPLAYLQGEHVFGFNGKHLGWFEDGIIWDHNGFATGFVKGAVIMPLQLEGLKGLKSLRPLRSLKELPPLKPIKTKSWSPTPLALFLAEGAD
jgi:hypothetical protein